MQEKDVIQQEYVHRNSRSALELFDMICGNEGAEAANHFMFYMTGTEWKQRFEALIEILRNRYRNVDHLTRVKMLEFLTLLAIGLKSYLIHLRLVDIIGVDEIERSYLKVWNLLLESESADKDAANQLCSQLIASNAKQFEAEGISAASAESEAAILVGNKPSQYVRRVSKKITSSNFYQYSIEQKSSHEKTILGNDYGEFLQYTMWLGYSFQTTNPPLIKMIWDLDRPYWSNRLLEVVAEMERSGEKLDVEKTCSLAAMIVVEKACRLLRDWFLLSEGKEGYVCFQVNPIHNGNSDAMVSEAIFVYETLSKRLKGVPNVSFKLPGTRAGLLAARVLSQKGYSLTITLNFTTFQAMEFGKVFKESKALTSYVVVMNGRLAYPVRDELATLGQNSVPNASWFAGVEVTRHIFQKFYSSEQDGGLGLDREKVKILNASLRVYGEEIPDISEIWGTPLITIFPNVRRAYDMKKRTVPVDSVVHQTEVSVMEDLKKSELFRQAWYVPQDDESFKPDKVLTLTEKDDAAVLEWLPIQQTLGQFITEYQKLRDIIEGVLATK